MKYRVFHGKSDKVLLISQPKKHHQNSDRSYIFSKSIVFLCKKMKMLGERNDNSRISYQGVVQELISSWTNIGLIRRALTKKYLFWKLVWGRVCISTPVEETMDLVITISNTKNLAISSIKYALISIKYHQKIVKTPTQQQLNSTSTSHNLSWVRH